MLLNNKFTGVNKIMSNSFTEYAVPDVVYIDVDGTLIINDRINHDLVSWARQQSQEGKEIIVWSARGKSNAENAVDRCEIGDIVSHALSKPGYIVDDLGNQWTEYMNIIHVDHISKPPKKDNSQQNMRISLI